MSVNKDAVLEMFDFLHDVITDISGEGPEWFKTFNEEFDKLREAI